ncbi:hypothetical protein N7462_002637 [Penicillium macrosclerotiorum]|uniref:uncharacterized protein n=1 Tax=Penicillium macrosclerotiorum TaxID=303699 RepID=UPI00254758B1|nr:uncharacterized protein N7462_002637 [Penicillium macrosclerotiorum]KAJ5693214.1 hypothetical protein N7462_002637 [Penicillium macrosclerotiorum]
MSQDTISYGAGESALSILYQHYRFVIDGPGLIKKGYARYSGGLFEIPRTFRFGQVILCKPALIEGLKNARAAIVSPDPWIDQVVRKQLDRYVPNMNEVIITQLETTKLQGDECVVGCFDFAFSVVARSGSFAIVGSRLSQDEEYLKAVKDHILGMIVVTRVQFLIPDWLKRYIGGLATRLVSLGTKWNMQASRKILLKHFDARASEYRDEMNCGSHSSDHQTNSDEKGRPIEIFRWLYEGCLRRQKWSYSEVIGELLLLQFAFIYTTAYGLYVAMAQLARHQEYVQPLREEIEAIIANNGPTAIACDQMILLDSFLKECLRMHPPAALSAHRVCVAAFKLSNGIYLRPGTHVAVPSDCIHRSSKYYKNPESFDGFRFVKNANNRLVDLSPDYLVFGMGSHSW